MESDIKKENANNQYLGHCLGCGRFEALGNVSGLCWQCRQKQLLECEKGGDENVN